jgi:hypothetical protein
MAKLSEEFKKSESLEEVLSKINNSIESIQMYPPQSPKLPILLIFGCPRSGTTLFLQWLASLGVFGYPSNLIARFFGNPAFGCEVQKALVDFDKGNQLGLSNLTQEYSSSLGRASGALAPSEFWYYWRRYFKFTDTQQLSEEELNAVDSKAFLRGLGAMESSIGKPLAMKGMFLDWHIPYLNSISEKFVFVSVKRNLADVARSMLTCRERYSGSRSEWWSLKPPQYREWLKLSPPEQVALQAYHTQAAVDEGMSFIPKERSMEVSYDSFCKDPESVFNSLGNMYQGLGQTFTTHYTGPKQFSNNTIRSMSEEDSDLIETTLNELTYEN